MSIMLKNNMPLVSIIVRTKDRPQLLKRALQSIVSQTFRPVEVVLVNDGGCELDSGELRTLLGDVSLNYLRLEKNTGRAHAGNVGIGNAKGEYIGFLDDDDEFCPEHVSKLISAIRHGDCAVCYTDSEIVDREYDFSSGEFTETGRRLFFSRDFSLYDLLIENYIPLINILIERDTLLSIGMFDETLMAYEDWDMLIRVASHHAFRHIRQVTAQYIQWSREHQIAQRSEHWAVLEEEYYKVVKKHISMVTPEVMKHIRDSMNDMRKTIRELETQSAHNKASAETTSLTFGEKEKRLSELEDYVGRIHSARGWKALTLYYRMKDRFLGLIRSIHIMPV